MPKKKREQHPKVMDMSDVTHLVNYKAALQGQQLVTRLAEQGYQLYSDELKKKYRIPRTHRLIVDPATREITRGVRLDG